MNPSELLMIPDHQSRQLLRFRPSPALIVLSNAYPVDTGWLFKFRFNRRFLTMVPCDRCAEEYATVFAGYAIFYEDTQYVKLIPKFDETIRSMHEDGEIEKIKNKWINEDP